MADSIKAEFGRRFRVARDAKKLSRAALGLRLGISPKTIQSWEMGRTFIEDLSLIPAIEAELDISVSDLISKAIGGGNAIAAEAPAAYGTRKRAYVKAGPVAPQFDVHAVKGGVFPDGESLESGLVAIPVLRPNAIARSVANLNKRDISAHTVMPAEWTPRGGVLVAYRMGDSGMSPMIPLGSTVIVDRRPLTIEKALNRVVALQIHNKGLRVRRLTKDPQSGKVCGMTAIEGRRGKIVFREDLGDIVLGKIVGILSQPE